jgi:hypothetical protein
MCVQRQDTSYKRAGIILISPIDAELLVPRCTSSYKRSARIRSLTHSPECGAEGVVVLVRGQATPERRALLDRWVSVTLFAFHLPALTKTNHHLQIPWWQVTLSAISASVQWSRD